MNRLRRPLAEVIADSDLGDWRPLIDDWRQSLAGRATIAAVDRRLAAGAVVYPGRVLRALELTRFAATRVVILGQDPYHGEGQAEGLAFSVPAGQRMPASLRNILQERRRDLGLAPPSCGSLAPWADQGVLLLNTALTVEQGQAASHSKIGWHALTSRICSHLQSSHLSTVFLLWGGHAQAQVGGLAPAAACERRGPHLLLRCNHPSPLSANRPPLPFVGCGHFGRAAEFLAAAGRGRVGWELP